MLSSDDNGLPVRFLAERLRNVSGTDLKNSVAKGALRVMEVRDQFQDYSVNFDEALMERLPFDIQRRGRCPPRGSSSERTSVTKTSSPAT